MRSGISARLISALLLMLCTGPAGLCQGVITTIAGTDWVFPQTALPALAAPLGAIQGVAVDTQGNIYVADPDNSMVMRIAPGGMLSVAAGNGIHDYSGDGGPATSASLSEPVSADRKAALWRFRKPLPA